MRSGGQRSYWNPYLAGLLPGAVLFATFFLTGHGLGASGGLAGILFAVQAAVAPDHVDSHAYLARSAGGEANPLDRWLVWIIAGVLAGGFVSGEPGRTGGSQ